MKVKISKNELQNKLGSAAAYIPLEGMEFEAESFSTFEQKILDELDVNEYDSMKNMFREMKMELGNIKDLLSEEHVCPRCQNIVNVGK